MSFDYDHHVLLWLLNVPLVGAIVVACLGPQRGRIIRGISLASSLVTLLLAAILAGRFMAIDRPYVVPAADQPGIAPPTFTPEFVPGSTDNEPHATTWDLFSIGPEVRPGVRAGSIQFYLGVDGLNIWLIVLTAVLSALSRDTLRV